MRPSAMRYVSKMPVGVDRERTENYDVLIRGYAPRDAGACMGDMRGIRGHFLPRYGSPRLPPVVAGISSFA